MNFAFAFEPKSDGLMSRKPNNPKEGVLTKRIKWLVFILSAITGALLIAFFIILQSSHYSLEKIRTLMFAALSIDSIFFTFSLKNLKEPIWKINLFSNMYLVFAFIISIAALLFALFLPPLQSLLSIAPLSGFELLIILGIGIFNLVAIELVKYYIFEKSSVQMDNS
jgi:Ca2+-transporting ATPase